MTVSFGNNSELHTTLFLLTEDVDIPVVLYSAARDILVEGAAGDPPPVVAPARLEGEGAGGAAAHRTVLHLNTVNLNLKFRQRLPVFTLKL